MKVSLGVVKNHSDYVLKTIQDLSIKNKFFQKGYEVIPGLFTSQ